LWVITSVDIIDEYGDEGFQLLFTYRDDFLNALDGKVVNVGAENADQFAMDVANLTGTKVWVSSTTGAVYASRSTDDAIDAAKHLAALKPGSSQRIEFIDKIVEESVRGGSSRIVLGRYLENGEYIQKAIDSQGSFLDVGPEVLKILDENNINFWEINERYLQKQLESGVEIDFVSGDILMIRDKYPGTFAAREINWLLEHAGDFKYQQVGNSWIKISP
jgi:hypothetical protein